jgi:hypothetical protein
VAADLLVWSKRAGRTLLPWKDISGSHKLAYTAFSFNKIPDFLKEAIARPKP